MKNKIEKFLDKKITIGEAIGDFLMIILFMMLTIFLFVKLTIKNYDYMDEHGNVNKSKICYERKGNLYCIDSVKVKWYMY